MHLTGCSSAIGVGIAKIISHPTLFQSVILDYPMRNVTEDSYTFRGFVNSLGKIKLLRNLIAQISSASGEKTTAAHQSTELSMNAK